MKWPLEDKPDTDELLEADLLRLISRTQGGLFGLDIAPEYGRPDVDIVTRTLNSYRQ